MRSLLIIPLLTFGCAGSKDAVRTEQTTYDPELYEACAPDSATDPPASCPRDDEGNWKTSRPPSSALLQGRRLLEEGLYEASAMTLRQAIMYDGVEDDCGKLYARWLRGQAFYKNGQYPEALKDFGYIVASGANNPFYKDVGDWLVKLEGKVPRGALLACQAQYRPDLAPQ